MKGKLSPEKKSQDSQTAPDRKAGSPAQQMETQALPLESLARMLGILELRDNHTMDKSFAKNAQTAKELEALPKKAESTFLGILAKCKIDGCDVHALDSSLNIINHYRDHEKIDEAFAKARPFAAALPDSIIAILVYSDHLSYLYGNGKLEVCHE